ncbi:MAG: CheR family methyltransferase [Desulfosoma sp.]
MNDADFLNVLKAFGLLWSGYRKVRKGAKRRLTALMTARGLFTVTDLLDRCSEDGRLREEVRRALAVPISRFFRDQRLWLVLETQVLPGVCTWSGETLRVWCAGCARGEEVYSLKILWHEWAHHAALVPRLELWATDFHEGMLEPAKHGVYHRSSLKEVSAQRQAAWFRPLQGDLFAVADELKQDIHWQCHDLVTENPPAHDFDLVFLRNNLLTYYEGAVQHKAFEVIVASLAEGGFLVVGSREKPPLGSWPLLPCAADTHLFRRVPFLNDFS